MFRKIRSNRDPRDTVFTELKKELRPYVGKLNRGAKQTAVRYPKVLFWFMVINLVLSAALSFTVFRHRRTTAATRKPVKVLAPVTGGFDRILQAGEAISEMMRLRKQIDSLSAKKKLAPADSVFLDSALTRFNQLNKQFNQRK